MDSESANSDPGKSQVDILIAEYLNRIDAGEVVTPDQFVTEHVLHADELRQYFSDVSLVDKIQKGSQPEAEQTMASLGSPDKEENTTANTLMKGAGDSETSITKQHLTEESDSKTVVEIPETFGRYKIKKVLGQGAMGAVYLARDTQLDRDVALKVPKFGDMSNVDEQEMLARFYREARAAATLRSPNICPVFDVGEMNGQHYITMAYIKGRPLKDFTKSKKRHSEKQIATTIRKLALGLEEAHEIGVIHRDLKPANIMVDKKAEPVVMDFGLARNSSDEVQVTQSGAIVGTPAYMSPEQVAGEQDLIGPQVDIYSLGVIMYELITGVMPFKGNLMAILQQIAINNPTKPSEIRANIDPRLENICLKMMAGDVRQRYQSMTEVANDLQECLRTPYKKTKNRSSQSESLKPTLIPTAEEESNPALISIETPKSYAQQLRAKRSKSSSSKTVEGSQAGIATPLKLMLAGGLGGVLLLWGIVLLVRSGLDEVHLPSTSPGSDKTKSATKTLELSKGLVGHWRFEDGSGTRVLDSSGKLNHGQLEGDVTWDFDSAPSPYAGKRSLRFDTGSMTVPASSSLEISDDMAFAFWCKMDEDQGARSFIRMGSMDINSGQKRVNFNYYLDGVEQRVFQDSGKFKPEGFYGGSWNHVVVNCSSGNGEIWWNGRLFASNPIEGKISDSIVDLIIGKEIQGSLDDFRIYNRSLNQSEILALANVEGNRDEFLAEPSQVLNPFGFNGNHSASELHSYINFEHGLAIKDLDDHVSTGGIEMDLSEPFCLEVWIAPKNLYDCKAYRRSIALFGPCQLFITNQGQFNFGIGVYEDALATVGLDKDVYATYEELKAELTHVAVQWTGEELLLFVNGKQSAQHYNIYGHSEDSADFLKRLLSRNYSGDLQLGAPLSKGSDGHFASNLYNVRISEGLRYTKNFKPEAFTKDPQTKLLYDFSDGQGNVLKDSSGNGYDGKIVGASWVEFKRSPVSGSKELEATESIWQNLIPLVDPALDVDGNGGKFEAEELVIGHRSTLTLPVIPDGDYEIRAEFTTWNGPKYLHVILPVGKRNPSVVLASHDNETGYLGAGLQLIDGFSVADVKNSTRQTEMFLRPNEKQTFQCRVISEDDQTTIQATIDDKTIIDWSGSANRLNKPEAGKSPQLKIWSYKGMLKMHSLELRMLNGKLQAMRP